MVRDGKKNGQSKINPLIFREYDIRGLVSEDLSDEVYELFGRGFGTYLKRAQAKGKKVIDESSAAGMAQAVVGRDHRPTSESYTHAFIQGLVSTGVSVVDVGEVATPIVYYYAFEHNLSNYCVITASHNPPEYNGLKLAAGFQGLTGESLREIRDLIKAGDFDTGAGGIKRTDDAEINYVMKMIETFGRSDNPRKIVIDCGNGMGSTVAPQVFHGLGHDVVQLNCKSDPSYPAHQPDPIKPENMVQLSEAVKKEHADLGVGFDGDADRLGVITNEGQLVGADLLLALFAREYLAGNPANKKIVSEVRVSRAAIEDIENNGGEFVMSRAGHSFIESKMEEEGAMIAGELSGHLFFKDKYHGFDDGFYAGLRFIDFLDNQNDSLTKLLGTLPRYFSTPEFRSTVLDEEKWGIIDALKEKFEKDHKVITLDGVRVELEHGWFLVRASNTAPQITVRAEGDTREVREDYLRMAHDALSGFPGVESPWFDEWKSNPGQYKMVYGV